MWTDGTPEAFPFPAEPLGAVPHGCARRRTEDPLGPVVLPSGDTVRLAVRFDDVSAVLRDPAFSRDLSRPGCPRLQAGTDMSDTPDTLVNMDPPRHTRVRRILSGAFAARSVERWRPRIRLVAEELAAGLRAEGSPADLVEHYAAPLPIRVITEMLGVAGGDLDRFRYWATVSMSIGADTDAERERGRADFLDAVRELVERHRREPGADLLDAMIAASDDGDRLSEAELCHVLRSLLLAGYETTMTTIGRGVFTLLRHPDQYADLVADPGLVSTAVDEVLRHDFPADVGFLRVATSDVRLPSGLVRRGEGVMPVISSANRDTARFTEPDTFDIRRGDRGHIAFGQGPHYCLGGALAVVQLQEALAVLTREFPDLALAVAAPEVPWNPSMVTHSIHRLPVTWGTGGATR